jgi:hypothetical protein
MDDKPQSRALLIFVSVLLLLPVLYVGSYIALANHLRHEWYTRGSGDQWARTRNYRVGGRRVEQFYWPLEQVDRKLRPHAWSSRP